MSIGTAIDQVIDAAKEHGLEVNEFGFRDQKLYVWLKLFGEPLRSPIYQYVWTEKQIQMAPAGLFAYDLERCAVELKRKFKEEMDSRAAQK
jgi:hypothetical protein